MPRITRPLGLAHSPSRFGLARQREGVIGHTAKASNLDSNLRSGRARQRIIRPTADPVVAARANRSRPSQAARFSQRHTLARGEGRYGGPRNGQF